MRPMRDPAPSRIAYRINRLMLTPRFRTFLRYGLPSLMIATAGVWWASDEDRVSALTDQIADARRQIEERPEFMVRMMAVDNASDSVAADIREVLPLDFPVSSFDLDLEQLRETVETLAPVASASVRIRKGGVLAIEVDERRPVAVWRTGDGLHLIDGEGVELAELANRQERADLPLVLGQGAETRVTEALALLDAAEPVQDRLRGVLRVGERRWDILLDRDQRIMLPESHPVRILEQVMALDRAQDLLARDLAVIDFRNPERPTLRLTRGAIEALNEADWTVSEESN